MPIYHTPMSDAVRKRYKAVCDYYECINGVNEELLGVSVKEMKVVRAMLSRIQDIGIAQEALYRILQDPLFENLSKHDKYWHSKHDDESDKLDDVRMRLSCLSDNLWDIWRILKIEVDDEQD